jgi:hypothetical protein
MLPVDGLLRGHGASKVGLEVQKRLFRGKETLKGRSVVRRLACTIASLGQS